MFEAQQLTNSALQSDRVSKKLKRIYKNQCSASTMEGSTGGLPAISVLSTICLGKERFSKSGKTLGIYWGGGGETNLSFSSSFDDDYISRK